MHRMGDLGGGKEGGSEREFKTRVFEDGKYTTENLKKEQFGFFFFS